MAKDVCHDTEKGTPHGGGISPLRATIALDGREKHRTACGSPRTVVRYADARGLRCATDRDAARACNDLGHGLRARGVQ